MHYTGWPRICGHLFFTRNTEKNPTIIFPNRIKKLKKKTMHLVIKIKVIFVLHHSIFQRPPCIFIACSAECSSVYFILLLNKVLTGIRVTRVDHSGHARRTRVLGIVVFPVPPWRRRRFRRAVQHRPRVSPSAVFLAAITSTGE